MTPDEMEANSRKYANDTLRVRVLTSGNFAVFETGRNTPHIVPAVDLAATIRSVAPRNATALDKQVATAEARRPTQLPLNIDIDI